VTRPAARFLERTRTTVRRVRENARTGLPRVLRLTVAAVAAYLAAVAVVDDRRPVTAALTALLIVQVTLVGTLADTARRILSVVAGVAIAIALAQLCGFRWWSLALIVAVSLVVGQALRLGGHLLEVPISGMLVLAAGGAGVQAGDRVAETIVGAAVGLLVNLVVPPATRTDSAGRSIERFARRLADVLDRAGTTMYERAVSRDEAGAWLHDLRAAAGDTTAVDATLAEARESRRLNPRVVGAADPLPDLRTGLDALEHVAVALRSVFRSVADGAGAGLERDRDGDPPADEPVDDAALRQRQALGRLVTELGRAVGAFGALARAGFRSDSASRDLCAALDVVAEQRRRLVEFVRLDPHASDDAWVRPGALLTGIDRVVQELDPEAHLRGRAEREEAALAAASPARQRAQRLRSSARRVPERGRSALRRRP
jgi:hypothetical protein